MKVWALSMERKVRKWSRWGKKGIKKREWEAHNYRWLQWNVTEPENKKEQDRKAEQRGSRESWRWGDNERRQGKKKQMGEKNLCQRKKEKPIDEMRIRWCWLMIIDCLPRHVSFYFCDFTRLPVSLFFLAFVLSCFLAVLLWNLLCVIMSVQHYVKQSPGGKISHKYPKSFHFMPQGSCSSIPHPLHGTIDKHLLQSAAKIQLHWLSLFMESF